jgi:Mn2+/Fe2+ NRAMP family transporter
VSPYLLNFYSSGAVEDGWDEGCLRSNRVVAWLGTAFGAVVSLAILVVSALVLAPRGIRVESYEQVALVLTPAFRRWGFALFVASLAVGCFGAALEIALNLAYVFAQAFGWNWGEDEVPRENARFCLTYTVLLVPPTLLMLSGVHPLRVTMLTMILTVIALPAVVFPLLVIMNDPLYLKRHTNGWTSNVFVVVIVVAGALMALASVPLAIFGGA